MRFWEVPFNMSEAIVNAAPSSPGGYSSVSRVSGPATSSNGSGIGLLHLTSTPSPASKAKKVASDKWIKVAAPVVTGNDEQDQANKQNWVLTIQCCEDIIAEPKLVASVFSTIREEKDRLTIKNNMEHQDQAQFKEVFSLHTIEEPWKLNSCSSKLI